MPRPSVPTPPSPTEATNRFGTRAVLATVALALVVVPWSLMLFLVETRWTPLLRADIGVRDSLNTYATTHPGFVTVMQMTSDSGSAVAWSIAFTGVVLWLLWRQWPRLALFVAFTAAVSSVLNVVAKGVVDRIRPVLADPVAQETGLSFPSGHAQSAIVGYGVLLFVFLPLLRGAWRRVAVTLAVFMVLAIGFSRMALGVHYLSDVVGGYVLGAAWVAAMAAAFDPIRVDRSGRGGGDVGASSAAGDT